ncbi:hypothetical protein, partial [Xenorhabdus indica]|uniref:hypothetical protein n=1 Tax=Xenorhabdus indica TaxID=333964 RepID=UPI001656ACDC
SPFWDFFDLAINQIAKIGLSSLQVIYYFESLFIGLHELPLETPLIDPFDLIFFGGFIIKKLASGGRFFQALTSRGAYVNLSIRLGEHLINILKGRLKIGLSAKKIKFALVPAKHMREPGRYVPVHILEKAIRYGKRMPDSIGKSSVKLQRYEIKMYKNRYNSKSHKYENKEYNLEVVVDEKNWTIVHFLYK